MITQLLIILALAIAVAVIGFGKSFTRRGFAKYFLIMLGIVGIIYSLVGIAGIYGAIDLGTASGFFLAVTPVEPVSPTGDQVPLTEQCFIAPSITSTVTDALTPGTAITPTNTRYRLNGNYLGTTAPTTRGIADILYNSSAYVNVIKSGVQVNCDGNLIASSMYSYANASLTYYSDNGLLALTEGTINETVKATGGSYNWKLHLQGSDKKSTGKMLLVVEMSVPANVSGVSLSAGQEVSVPDGYARQLTNGYTKAFLLPELVGNKAVDYNLGAVSQTGKLIIGEVFTTLIAVEPFVETDGTFSDLGKAYDSLNVARYQDVQTKNFYIQ